MKEIEHHRITANGLNHHYVTAGSGRPLVLLHGFPQTWLQWRPLIELLSEQYRVIAPDLRGLSGSPGPASGYDKHSLADDVHAILEAEGVEGPITLCGHDMGAYVAFAYALDYRDGVESLVMVDAPPPGTTYMDQLMTNPRTWHIAFHSNADVAYMLINGREREYIDYFIKSRIYDQSAVTAEEIDAYAAAYSAPGALRAALEMYRALVDDRELNQTALRDGGKLTMPVVVVGSGVTAAGAALEAMVKEIATDGRVEIVEKAGHWIPEEKPRVLADIITGLAGGR